MKDVTLAYPGYSKEFELHSLEQSAPRARGQLCSLVGSSLKLSKNTARNFKKVQGHTMGAIDHGLHGPSNLTKDAREFTSHRVYQWRLLLKEYDSNITFIKGIHNTVADAIS
ncbi:hypothetical protein ACHAW6_014677 [Cyclotella cf. meneghiniana]